MKIVFNPSENKENAYISILVKALREAHFTVYPLDNLLSSFRHFKSVKLVHLNWFENIDDRSLKKAFISFFRKMVVLTAIKLGKKKLVWTMHNRTSHEKGLSFFSRTLTRLLMQSAHRIIIHSWASKEIVERQGPHLFRKIYYLPHPDFIGIYGPKQNQNETDHLRLQLLFVGVIKPYKNIELLIELAREFSSSIHLTIAGKPHTPAYARQLQQLAQSTNNITLALKFIPDNEIPTLFSSADLLVLPYDLSSSLNSGTVILAFSYAKTVICPTIGTITDLGQEQEHVLCYDYEYKEQHKEKLRKKIQEAVEMKNQDAHIFEKKGQHLFEYVKNKHNKQAVGKELVALYQHLLA